MSWLSSLRSKWQRHDEELAEHAYRERGISERLEEHGPEVNSAFLGAGAEGSLFEAQGTEAAIERDIRADDALEHEAPE